MKHPYSQNNGTWRTLAAPIIAKTIFEVTGRHFRPFTDEEKKAIRKALLPKYPFSDRELHPYRAWRKEIRFQLDGGKDRSYKRMEKCGQQRMFG